MFHHRLISTGFFPIDTAVPALASRTQTCATCVRGAHVERKVKKNKKPYISIRIDHTFRARRPTVVTHGGSGSRAYCNRGQWYPSPARVHRRIRIESRKTRFWNRPSRVPFFIIILPNHELRFLYKTISCTSRVSAADVHYRFSYLTAAHLKHSLIIVVVRVSYYG